MWAESRAPALHAATPPQRLTSATDGAPSNDGVYWILLTDETAARFFVEVVPTVMLWLDGHGTSFHPDPAGFLNLEAADIAAHEAMTDPAMADGVARDIEHHVGVRRRGWRALESVVTERREQRARYDERHDDTLRLGELAIWAAGLAVDGTDAHVDHPDKDPGETYDPRELIAKYGFKGSQRDRRKALVVATALLLAEIERLDREGA